MPTQTIRLTLPRPHEAQQQILAEARRWNVVCAGRRFGKTAFGVDRCSAVLLKGQPVGWFAPTYKVLSEGWRDVCRALKPVTKAKNDADHRLELITGGVLEMWSLVDKDAGRSRHYASVFVDEGAMVPDLLTIWDESIRATLVDLAGDAWFFSTPKGKNAFATLWDRGQDDEQWPDWKSWRFASYANPYLKPSELDDMKASLPARAFEQEVEARFIDEVTGALWKLDMLERNRVKVAPELARVVIGVDPAGSTNADSDETGIVAAGVAQGDPTHGYVLADASGRYSPEGWARAAVNLYHEHKADRIVVEGNFGGDMVVSTIRAVDASVPVKKVHASRGKVIRAEPIVAFDEQGRIHHVGHLTDLETQMTTWSPVDDKHSPDRVDARVWALSDLMLKKGRGSGWTGGGV
jgi:phage terminase large subunit-like protein